VARNEFANRLHESGHRVTPQRQAIWDSFEPGKHLTVEDIHQIVFGELRFTDTSTVYRTMELLKDLGLVRELVLEMGTYYEGAHDPEPHGHFICRSCGSITDLSMSMDFGFDQLPDMSSEDYSATDIVIYGQCSDPRDPAGPKFSGGSVSIGLKLSGET